MRLTIRDLFWLILVVAIGCAWWNSEIRWRALLQSIKATKSVYLFDPRAEDWQAKAHPLEVRLLQVTDSTDRGEIWDEDLSRITEFSNLEVLLLGCPKLTDKAIDSILKLKKLRCIAIYSGQFTDAGVQSLAQLNQLEVIAFCETDISPIGVSRLKKLSPTLAVESVGQGDNGLFHAGGCLTSAFLLKAKSRN